MAYNEDINSYANQVVSRGHTVYLGNMSCYQCELLFLYQLMVESSQS